MSDTTEPTEGSTKYPTPTGVRVLRLMEYVYDDAETAAEDMARWTRNMYLPGRPGRPPRLVMRSMDLPFSSIEWAAPVTFETAETREPPGPLGRILFGEEDTQS